MKFMAVVVVFVTINVNMSRFLLALVAVRMKTRGLCCWLSCWKINNDEDCSGKGGKKDILYSCWC